MKKVIIEIPKYRLFQVLDDYGFAIKEFKIRFGDLIAEEKARLELNKIYTLS